MSKDSSLQLLLIVDYIFDWAQDIYRPSILRQLKLLVTRSTFDQISLTDDSNVFSMRRNIPNWIQAAPSTVAGLDFEHVRWAVIEVLNILLNLLCCCATYTVYIDVEKTHSLTELNPDPAEYHLAKVSYVCLRSATYN